MPACLNWKPIPPRRPRNAPDVFAVEQLKATAGRGAVPERNSGTAGERWVVVEGTRPLENPLASSNKFKGAAGMTLRRTGPIILAISSTGPRWGPPRRAEPAGSSGCSRPSIARNRPPRRLSPRRERLWMPVSCVLRLPAPLPLLTNSTWGKEVAFPPANSPPRSRGGRRQAGQRPGWRRSGRWRRETFALRRSVDWIRP